MKLMIIKTRNSFTVRDTSFVHPTVEAPPWKIHGVLRVSPCSTECYFFYTQKSTETHGGSRSDIDSRALSGPPSV